MHPITHVLIGWTVANCAKLELRDRTWITVAGFVPDVDGLGVIPDILTEGTKHPTYLYGAYHHALLHNLAFGLLLFALTWCFSRRRTLTAGLVFLSFHLHLLGDLVGSRGPDGYQWPIPYLAPFRDAWQLTWSHQWALKAWPNVTLTIVLLMLALHGSWKWGRSPLELVSLRADAALTKTLRARFGPCESI
jgi:inner membrane protein